MGKEMKFNSQICTTRKQSERLLALGLKKETADMGFRDLGYGWREYFVSADACDLSPKTIIPTWSLHRLIEIIGDMFEVPHRLGFNIEKDYDYTIDRIEWLIEDGHINKEYLKD